MGAWKAVMDGVVDRIGRRCEIEDAGGDGIGGRGRKCW